MRRTRKLVLLAIAVVSLAVNYGFFTLLKGQGVVTPPVSYLTHLVLLVMSVWLFFSGRAVRKMAAGESSNITPLGAARVVAAAKTLAVVGSITAGYFGAAAIALGILPSAPVRASGLVTALSGVAVAVGAALLALLVEHWCQVDPDPPTTARPA